MRCLITLRSSTYAMRAQTVLRDHGMEARALKLDGEYLGKGCTHGIRFDCKNRVFAERLLKENGIPYSEIRIE